MSTQLKLIDQGIISREPGRGAYMPGILLLPDGTFLAFQHVGSDLAAVDNSIEVLRSTDAGRTWTNQGCIHKPHQGWAYRVPAISLLPDGRLIMVATRFRMDADVLFDPASESLARGEILVFWSTDSGHSWSEPEVVSVPLPPEKYAWNSTGTPLQISAQRWMLPLETWKPQGYVGPPDQKAAALFSSDQGRTWGQFTIIADDTTGKVLWWDQMSDILPDGRLYIMFWTHKYGTSDDLNNHWATSQDQGRTWSQPRPTNLRGQVCAPIALPDGRVAAIYNYRHEPQGIHVALTEDLETFDLENEVVVFDAGAEAALGQPDHENFLAEHHLIGFGKPGGTLLPDGDLLTYFWCTSGGVTHTRWVRLRV